MKNIARTIMSKIENRDYQYNNRNSRYNDDYELEFAGARFSNDRNYNRMCQNPRRRR